MAKSGTGQAYARPPAQIRDVFKQNQKGLGSLDAQSVGLVPAQHSGLKSVLHSTDRSCLSTSFHAFVRCSARDLQAPQMTSVPDQIDAYEVEEIPGLFVFPKLLPSSVQTALLEQVFERDLLNPIHQTNMHLHYDVQYPDAFSSKSFFDLAKDTAFMPKNSLSHRPLSIHDILEKKLRWLTLGGQYDWTRKLYPDDLPPPPFPDDLKQLLESIFRMKAEAAIVNLYSLGDTLSLHRDLSEMCDQPLVSLSLGCDCIFVIGLEQKDGICSTAALTLHSGDVVLMSGPSRYAWHGVPKVFPDTCPQWLQSWPGAQHPEWQGWMGRKRININVRQMFDHP